MDPWSIKTLNYLDIFFSNSYAAYLSNKSTNVNNKPEKLIVKKRRPLLCKIGFEQNNGLIQYKKKKLKVLRSCNFIVWPLAKSTFQDKRFFVRASVCVTKCMFLWYASNKIDGLDSNFPPTFLIPNPMPS